MKFDIKNRWSGKVQLTTEIDTEESTYNNIKLGLAVKWALKNNADLRGAYLRGAYLLGALWSEGVFLTKPPIQISGLPWLVNILDTHMEVGCKLHSHEEWEGFSDRQILEMDGKIAAAFWRQYKEVLLSLCKLNALAEKQEAA